MVSFYRLKYTSFISTDNYLVGDPHEISPESRFLALGARKGYVIADLNYSCFLARRASLFLFGSLVRRSHPAVSFGHRFRDYEDLFSEFSALSLSYVRDWVPGLLTNYKVLFRTALKEEGALRRIGFFFQFPDILLMFGSDDSMGFIVNEARAIKMPTIVTGDTSISFSRITYMLLSNYKSFKSTVFFVKLFLDLNAESSRFRTLRHYSIFKRFIKSIFLRRTLKSKLSSIKLSSMFFIFKTFTELRVSQITPVIYKDGGWRPSSFFKVLGKPKKPGGRSVMLRSRKGNIGRLTPIRGKEYVANRPTLPRLPALVEKLRRGRLIIGMKLKSLPKWKGSVMRLKKAKVLKRRAGKLRSLRRRRAKRLLRASLITNRPVRLRKLLTAARRRGLRVEGLLKKAKVLSSRLRLLNRPGRDHSNTALLPAFMVDRGTLRQIFPLLGYFAYGYMTKRLNTLFFYRAIFKQLIQKRKKILRLKSFTNDLGVISTQAKRFRALNLAVNRRRSSILKLRSRVKKFGKRFKAVSRLRKLRKAPGFDEQLYMKKLLDRNKADKRMAGRFSKNSGRGRVDKGKGGKYHKNGKFGNKDNRDGRGGYYNSKDKSFSKNSNSFQSRRDSEQLSIREAFMELLDKEQGVKDSVTKNKPKWLKVLGRINKESYKVLKEDAESKPRRRKLKTSSGKASKLTAKRVPTTLIGSQRALVAQNFTPTQRHILRVYRILSTKYPLFMRKSEAKFASGRKTVLIPRTLRQYLVKTRKLKSEAFFRRTGKVRKFRETIDSLLPKPFKRGGFGQGKGGGKPWHKNRGKGFSDFSRDFKKPYDPNYRNRNWSKGGNVPYGSGHKKDWADKGEYSRRPSYKPDYKNRNWGSNAPYKPGYSKKDSNYPKKPYDPSYKKDWKRKDGHKDGNASYKPDYKNRNWDNKGKSAGGPYPKKPYDPNYNRDKHNRDTSIRSYNPDYKKGWKDRSSSKGSNAPYKPGYSKKDSNYPKKPYDLNYNKNRNWDNKGKSADANAVRSAPNNRGREDKGANYPKGKANVQNIQLDKNTLSQPDHRKSKKFHGKAEKGEINVINSEPASAGKNKSVIFDKGPQDGGNG